MIRYVVPAARPLTVLHIQNEDRGLIFDDEGFTLCGIPFDPADLWRVIDCRQEDRICIACVRTLGDRKKD